jgi:hypothetical protein
MTIINKNEKVSKIWPTFIKKNERNIILKIIELGDSFINFKFEKELVL